MRDIAEAQKAGKTVNRDWLRRSFRYQQLINQAQFEIKQFSNGAGRLIEAKQRQAIELGQFHATGLIEAALPEITFTRLPSEAIQELVGVLQDGSPLSKVLDKLGPEAAKEIKEVLVSGLGSGHGAAKIAREIRRAVDIPRWLPFGWHALRLCGAYDSFIACKLLEKIMMCWMVGSGRRLPRHPDVVPLAFRFMENSFRSQNNFSLATRSVVAQPSPSVKGSDFKITPGAEIFAALPPPIQLNRVGSDTLRNVSGRYCVRRVHHADERCRLGWSVSG